MRWAAVLVMLAPLAASADPASQLFEEGRALLQQGKAAEACAKFEASLKLDPQAPGVVLNLGLCNVQRHKVATALKWFRKAQAFGDVETVAKQQVMTLSALVPTVRIEAPAGVPVVIDGDAIDPGAFGRLELDAGHHTADVGGAIQPFEVTDDPSRTQLITLHGPAPAVETVIDRGASRRKAAWIVGGIGGGLVVTSAVIGFVGRSEFNGSHDLATRQHWKSIVEYGGTSLFVAGCAAIAVATGLYVTAPGPEHTTVTPVAAPGQVGLSVTGAF